MTYVTPTQPGAQPGPPPPPVPPRSFFGRLFDLQFRGFVTPMIVSVLYVLGMIMIALGYLYFIAVGFAIDEIVGVLIMFIVGPMVSAFLLLFLRLLLEFYVAITRLADDVSAWRAEWHRRQASS